LFLKRPLFHSCGYGNLYSSISDRWRQKDGSHSCCNAAEKKLGIMSLSGNWGRQTSTPVLILQLHAAGYRSVTVAVPACRLSIKIDHDPPSQQPVCSCRGAMTSLTKAEFRNILHSRLRRTEPQASGIMRRKFGEVRRVLSIAISVYVCLSHCPLAYLKTGIQTLPDFLCMMPVAQSHMLYELPGL